MSAEQLIALEAAQAELGTLYIVARRFVALQARAEAELLPRLVALGSRMRALLRAAQLTPDQLEVAAQEIRALRGQWHAELGRVHASPLYQRALAAVAANRQDELKELIPQVLAGLRLISPSPTVYFPVSPSTGRRRPGSSPFLSAAACADKIVQMQADGIVPEDAGAEGWGHELASISGTRDLASLETPIALLVAATDVRCAVFGSDDEPGVQIFAPRLVAPMTVVLAAEANDEWWEAYEDSYSDFRDALRQELEARGRTATIINAR